MLTKGGHGRRNISADLQMVAACAAQVVRGGDVSGSHASSSHSPEQQYRQPTANGNSVSCYVSHLGVFITSYIGKIEKKNILTLQKDKHRHTLHKSKNDLVYRSF